MATYRFWKTLAGALLVSAAVAALSACAAPRGRLYVHVGPPAPIVEMRVIAPGPEYMWIPGYHMWNGSAHLWVPGRWDRPPRARARWVPARWIRDGRRGWYLVEGHWR